MAEFEYSPFDKKIRLCYVCSDCRSENCNDIEVPEPDWSSDSHSASIRSEYIELTCVNCGKQYPLTLATGISGGIGILDEIEDVDVSIIEEEADSNDEKDREDFEEKNAPEVITPPTDIVAFNEMRSCADIYRMYSSNQIDINPDFQRGVVWKNRAQTLFVDSVLKQLPIPSICVSLDGKSQKRLVIDGLQRITTMIKFLAPDSKWVLSKIDDVDKRIRGKKVSELREIEPDLFELFENFVIPITVIRCDYLRRDHMQYLFQIFNRLNSGGSKLYNQEIRNCIYQGPFNTLIKNLARSERWCTFANVTPMKVVQARFGHEERILRFFAFYEQWSCYLGRFAAFLNDYMDTYKYCDSRKIEEFNTLFKETLDIANKLNEHNMTKVVADAVLVAIAKNRNKLKDKTAEELKSLYLDMMGQEEFSVSELSHGLSQKDRVINRIKKAIEVFGRD